MSIQLKDYLHDALDMVAQTSTTEAFYHQFQAIKSLLAAAQPEIPEAYFATIFTYGLQLEFQASVLRFNPIRIMSAFRLACIYEESIYLHYFPELMIQNDDCSMENSVEENHIDVPYTDKSCKDVVVEDFSSACTSTAYSGSVEESAVDTLDVGVAVSSQRHDTLYSIVTSAIQRIDISSSNMVHQKSASSLDNINEKWTPTVEAFPFDHCVDNPEFLHTRYFHGNSVPDFVLVPCTSWDKIIYLKIGCFCTNLCPNCLEVTENSARTFQHPHYYGTVGAFIDIGQQSAVNDYVVEDQVVTKIVTRVPKERSSYILVNSTRVPSEIHSDTLGANLVSLAAVKILHVQRMFCPWKFLDKTGTLGSKVEKVEHVHVSIGYYVSVARHLSFSWEPGPFRLKTGNCNGPKSIIAAKTRFKNNAFMFHKLQPRGENVSNPLVALDRTRPRNHILPSSGNVILICCSSCFVTTSSISFLCYNLLQFTFYKGQRFCNSSLRLLILAVLSVPALSCVPYLICTMCYHAI